MTSARSILLLVLGVLGCDGSPLDVVHHQPPDPATCMLSQGPSGRQASSGTFDLVVGERDSYTLTPLVVSHVDQTVTLTSAHVELEWEVNGALTALSIVCAEGLCREWDLPLCAPGGACPVMLPGRSASFEVPALPRVVTAYFQGLMDGAVAEGRVPPEFRVVSRVVLEGTLADGTAVSSDEHEHEIRLCLGCLVTFPPGSDSPLVDGPDCCGAGAPLPACFPGQDDPIDCRRCARSFPELCNFGRLSCGL